MAEKFSRRMRITATIVSALGVAVVGTGIGTHLAGIGEDPNAAPSRAAARLSAELYDQNDFPNGVPVPGILNGTVTLEGDNGSGLPDITYTDPVLLERPNTLTGPQSLEGVWIGIPDYNEQGHVVLDAVQIHVGEVSGQTESVHLNNPNEPVLSEAAIYSTHVADGPDALRGFNATGNGDFPSTLITASLGN